jgi:hypothetical protein
VVVYFSCYGTDRITVISLIPDLCKFFKALNQAPFLLACTPHLFVI